MPAPDAEVLARFQRPDAEEERSVHPHGREERGGRLDVGWRQVVGSHGDDVDGIREGSGIYQVGRHYLGGDDEPVGPLEGAAQRRLVPPAPPRGIGLGDPSPQEIVDRGHQGRPTGNQGGERCGLHHVEPAWAPEHTPVPGPGQEGPGQRVAMHRTAELDQRIGAAADRRVPAGHQCEGGAVGRAEIVEPLEQTPDVGSDPARRRAPELLGHHQQSHAHGAAPTGPPRLPVPSPGERSRWASR